MTAYYNEIDPYPAQWTRNLIAAGHVAPGRVDERSIRDVQPADVADATQAHFFSGIGVWSYALRLAGWDDTRPVWTGSCPCQPFSVAGKRGGTDDERHLWPEWFRLIREQRPPVVFGEQVASPDGLDWLDAVSRDLEASGYAFAAADLCAAGVGAPHIRQRLYFVAYAHDAERKAWRPEPGGSGSPIARDRGAAFRGAVGNVADSMFAGRPERRGGAGDRTVTGSGGAIRMADAASARREGIAGSDSDTGGQLRRVAGAGGSVGGVGDSSGTGSGRDARAGARTQAEVDREGVADGRVRDELVAPGADGSVGNADNAGSQGRGVLSGSGPGECATRSPGEARGVADADGGFPRNGELQRGGRYDERAEYALTRNPWADAEWIACSDGKSRPTQPGAFPLVDGSAFRVGSGSAFEGKSRAGMLRGYGNAIVAPLAATFIRAFMDSPPQTSAGGEGA